MPYIHWEADQAQRQVSDWINEVKLDSEKTSGAKENKLWPSEKDRVKSTSTANGTGRHSTDIGEVSVETPEAKEDYQELLRRYLFKRRPVHLRRTLDQYYYSHLADTKLRDGDQVVMRQLNEDKKQLKLKADSKFKNLKIIQEKEEEIAKSSFLPRIFKKVFSNRPKKLDEVNSQILEIEQTPYRDSNSPILMVDQLWLWVINESLLSIT
jgi:hypothetical protein